MNFHLFPAVPMEREIITLERNSARDGCAVVTVLGFIIISSRGLLVFFPVKMCSHMGWLISQKSWFCCATRDRTLTKLTSSLLWKKEASCPKEFQQYAVSPELSFLQALAEGFV